MMYILWKAHPVEQITLSGLKLQEICCWLLSGVQLSTVVYVSMITRFSHGFVWSIRLKLLKFIEQFLFSEFADFEAGSSNVSIFCFLVC